MTKFLAQDPHAQAYDVLWTFRGREMTRLLAAPNRTDDQPLSDAGHFQVVQQRCIGCHATPLPHDAVQSPSSFALGVHCESCHGAAGDWLHSHYQTGFENESIRSSARGFSDTKQLDQRAAACMQCHVGPNDAAGTTQVVDHDLIAAGHPRLAFEFHSYFQSLPAHWNRQVDEAKHPGAFHFRSWLAGQLQTSKLKDRLVQDRPADFANLDCFACHHSLAPDAWRQPAKFASLKAVPWPSLPLPSAGNIASLADRLRLARALVESSKTDGRWDAALQSYLATRAIAGDIQNHPALDSALTSLASYLGETCFARPKPAGDERAGNERAGHSPTPYDSPTAFSPTSYAEHAKIVLDALQRLEATAR